jgi:hypothetical protein
VQSFATPFNGHSSTLISAIWQEQPTLGVIAKVPQELQKQQRIGQFSSAFIWSLLNRSMNYTRKNRMTNEQYAVAQRQRKDTKATNKWLAASGIKSTALFDTDIKLLKAQEQATYSIKHYSDLLTSAQRKTLMNFRRKMKSSSTRQTLTIQSAAPILNICSKINRQLFKRHRQLHKA